ncbi:GH32 C-terminal domain-containing protein [Pontibacter sp. CAU 1760]
MEEVSNVQFPVANELGAPERIPAVQGSALRLDGYSTYAQSAYSFPLASKQMTIEAWYATEAFPPSTDAARNPIEGGAIISQIRNGAGFALKIGPYGNVILDFYAGGQRYTVTTPNTLEKYAWNHIVATIDLEAKQARIFVNGNLWKTASLAAHNAINFADVLLYIGRHNTQALIEGFNLNTLNGAIDDLKVYNGALTVVDITTLYRTFAPAPAAKTIFEGFEGTSYGDWAVTGTAFGSQPVAGTLAGQHPVEGYQGSKLVNSFLNGDASLGKLVSPTFTINKPLIKFLVGGGNHPGKAEVRLRINGDVVRSATGSNSEVLREENWDVSELMNATARIEIVDEVSGGWGHILADHIVFTEKQQLLHANLTIDPAVRHAGDYLRPQYHPMPSSSWANEPYGLTYHNGKYHLFFQKNPNGLWLHFMHWGHLSSPDLVHWREEKVALAPSPGFDDFGVWSGTTIKDDNGKPVIFYTGVDLGKAGIGIAFPKDDALIEWEKSNKNPVIPAAPAGHLDFRDPFVWKDGGTYYMIVGSGLAGDGGGTLPTYKSKDLVNWTRTSTLFSSSKLEESGFFWEMPLFYPLNNKGDYLLAVTPLFRGEPANVVYWIGKFENEKFEPYFQTPKLFEPVRDNLLAPAIGTDEAGRITYIGIVPESRNVPDQLKAGWRQMFSIPRVLRLLNDSTIGHYPHPNLCRLRQNEKAVLNRAITKNSSANLPELGGNQINLDFTIKADSASQFALQLLKNAAGTQYTSVTFDLGNNLVGLDTRAAHAREAQKEYTTASYAFDFKEDIHVEVFVDHSVVEVFIDNLLVLSTRSYPEESSQAVDIVVTDGGLELKEAKQWEMQRMGSSTGAAVCEPAFLPAGFRDLPKGGVLGLEMNEELRRTIKLYPNPSSDVLKVELPQHLGAYQLALYSINGVLVKTGKGHTVKQEISTSGMAKGVYMLSVKGERFYDFFKVVIVGQ